MLQSNVHYIKFKVGLGDGSNNYDECMALKLLMKYALERDLKKIQIFSYSTMTIDQINNKTKL